MKMDKTGISFLKEVEGIRTEVYSDVAGFPTIGVGHRLSPDQTTSGKIIINGREKKLSKLTVSDIENLLRNDLKRFENTVNKYVDIEISQNEFNALTSFAFNVGSYAFRKSTLLKRLNEGNRNAVPNEIERWIYAGGKKIKGLINRRQKEIELWKGEYVEF